jgi:RNA polymerase sigma-70 factor, ECF subfamily
MARDKPVLPLRFEELMERYEREIMRYLLRVSGNRDDAADLFQETWLRAYRAYPRLEADSAVRPWLYAIATNLCRNRARDGARRARVIVSAGRDGAGADDSPARDPVVDENHAYATIHIREAICALPARQRQALHLRHFAGLDYGGIAAAMDCTEESARANVSQAMRKLKAALGMR